MPDTADIPKKEGVIYKTVVAGGHSFTLRYGYYEDYERSRGEPVVIYPDLGRIPLYSDDGYRVVTAVQDACGEYVPRGARDEDACCCDCIFYPDARSCIGVCACISNRKKQPANI